MIWWYLSELDLDAKRVLHFAPELPLENRLRAKPRSYLTVDFRNPHVDRQVDIQELPFEDKSFDVVVCSHVLEHIYDDQKAMRELHRVTSDTGFSLVMVPQSESQTTREDLTDSLDPETRRARFGEVDHLREYGMDIVQMLERAGFHVRVFEPAKEIAAEPRIRYGLGDNQIMFLCTRNPVTS